MWCSTPYTPCLRGERFRVRAENVVLGAGDALPLPAGRYILVAVQDTGVGIPRDLLPNVFHPYVTSKSKAAGSGWPLP